VPHYDCGRYTKAIVGLGGFQYLLLCLPVLAITWVTSLWHTTQQHTQHFVPASQLLAKSKLIAVWCLQLVSKVLVQERKRLIAAEQTYMRSEDTMREQVCLAEHSAQQGHALTTQGFATLQVRTALLFYAVYCKLGGVLLICNGCSVPPPVYCNISRLQH
jgi:hypothetical protein